jgi:hypothetical protein
MSKVVRMEIKVDDFVYVFIAAVIILAIFGIISFVSPWFAPVNNVTVASLSIGEVGAVTDYAARSIALRTFAVGEEQTESLVSSPELEISRGWFGGNDEVFSIVVPDYYLETARGVRISFNVYDTNRYANLKFKWNGVVMEEDDYDTGFHSLLIGSEDVKPSNTLTVMCDGPGMMFWASTVYQLRNFNVNLEYGPERVIPFEMLPSEMQNFERIDVTFFATGTGTLEVKANGVSVYQGHPSGAATMSFNLFDAPVHAGQNIMTFIDRDGTYTLQDTDLKIYLATSNVEVTRGFNMSQENYNLMLQGFQGRVNFFIDNVASPGSLEIILNDKVVPVSTPQVGWNTASFTSGDAVVGENVITFSGTGNYQITSARIELER